MRKYSFIFCLAVLLLCGCVPTDITDIEPEKGKRSVAMPLINTSIGVTDIEGKAGANVKVLTDEKGRVTVEYLGEVVSRDWSVIAPTIPIVPFTFEEPKTDILFMRPDGRPFLTDEVVNIMHFSELNIAFQINHSIQDDITLDISIPQLKKDGKGLSVSYDIPYTSGTTSTQYTSAQTSLSDYIYETTENQLYIEYEARKKDGTIVTLDQSAGLLSPFNASYLEGYLGYGRFDIEGNIVTVGLFNQWKSGGADFTDPRIDIHVENSLGIPLTSDVERFSITNSEGIETDIESPEINNGIVFNYPLLDERGEVKSTDFSLTKENSNVEVLFQDRIKQLNYKINAIYNKDRSREENQFVDNQGFVNASVSVVLPLEGTINELELVDTVDLDFGNIDDIVKAELKTLIVNDFPLDINMQAYILDEDGVLQDSLFATRFAIAGAQVGSDGKATPTEEQITYTDISTEKYARIKDGKQVAISLMLNSASVSDTPVWVYDAYDLHVKMGAKIDIRL